MCRVAVISKATAIRVVNAIPTLSLRAQDRNLAKFSDHRAAHTIDID